MTTKNYTHAIACTCGKPSTFVAHTWAGLRYVCTACTAAVPGCRPMDMHA